MTTITRTVPGHNNYSIPASKEAREMASWLASYPLRGIFLTRDPSKIIGTIIIKPWIGQIRLDLQENEMIAEHSLVYGRRLRMKSPGIMDRLRRYLPNNFSYVPFLDRDDPQLKRVAELTRAHLEDVKLSLRNMPECVNVTKLGRREDYDEE